MIASNLMLVRPILMRTFRATAFVVISIWLLIQPAFAEGRIALVIGNGSYEKVPELLIRLVTRPTLRVPLSD